MNNLLLGQNTVMIIAVIIVLCVFEIVVHVVVSVQLLKSVDVNPSVGDSYHIHMAGQCANALTPFRAGIPMRLILYKKIFGLESGKGVGIILLETVLFLVSVFLLAMLGVYLFFFDRIYTEMWLYCFLIAFLLMVFLSTVIFFIKKNPNLSNPFFLRVIYLVRSILSSLLQADGRLLLVVVGLFVVSFLVQGVRLSAVLSMYSVAVVPLALASAITIAYTAGAASMLPFGIGVRDGAMAVLLAGLGLDAAAVGIAVVAQRIFSPGMYLLLGSYSYYSLIKLYKDAQQRRSR